MYKKIDIKVSPKLIEGTLLEKEICDCGFCVVENAIVGKRYMCDLNSVRWARWTCYGCGKITDVRLIDIYSAVAFVPVSWFFLDLLDIGAGLRAGRKPIAWEPVRDGHVSPKGISDRGIAEVSS